MRTFQNNALSIEYPDTLVMAFDAVAINLTALNASENPSYKMTAVITDTDANKSLTDIRTAHEGLMSFDLAGYVRALMAPHMDEPFKADADGYLPVTRDFSVELLWAGVSVLTFAFTAVWGSLPIGGTFNASRSVKIWQGYPNITAIFGRRGTKINGSVVFRRTKLLPLPSTVQTECYFAMPSMSPWSLCTRSEDNRTLESSITAGTKLYNKSFTDAPMTFDGDGNYLILNTDGVTGINYGVMAIKAPEGKKIVSWTIDIVALLNTTSVGITTSNGVEYGIDGNTGATITVKGLSCQEDTFSIVSNMATDSSRRACFMIDIVNILLEDIGTGQVSEQTINITDDIRFLTYQRTGTMTLQGTGREVQVKTVMQCGSEGAFLRWIDGQGFPVSWLFRKGSEQRKVKASSAYRANMKDGLYVNDGNAQQLQVDSKDAKVTQDLAASLVTADEYDTLRSILTSPVVELWDGERWQRVNVSAGTDKRSTAVKQQFEFSIIMPEEVAQQL